MDGNCCVIGTGGCGVAPARVGRASEPEGRAEGCLGYGGRGPQAAEGP